MPPHDELKSSNLLQFGTETGLSSKHDPLKNKCATIYPPRQVPEDEFEVIEQGTILLVKEENTEKNETKVTKKRGPKPKRLADKVEIVAPRSSISEPNSKATDRNVNELSCMDTDVWSMMPNIKSWRPIVFINWSKNAKRKKPLLFCN